MEESACTLISATWLTNLGVGSILYSCFKEITWNIVKKEEEEGRKEVIFLLIVFRRLNKCSSQIAGGDLKKF